jgi:hypothetical protein
MHDVIIIWWWAAGLFCSIFLPKEFKKIIIEKSDKLWSKVLLSWGGRCNFSNANFDVDKNYFWENKKNLHSRFHAFDNQDMINFLEVNGLQIKKENNWRLIVFNNKAKDLVNLLVSKSVENKTEHFLSQNILNIEKINDHFVVETQSWKFESKKLIIASGGKSYPQIWASCLAYDVAGKFGIKVSNLYQWLCGLETVKNLSSLTGNAVIVNFWLKFNGKIIYEDKWNLLFTHRGISGPVVFDCVNAIWEFLNKKKLWLDEMKNFEIQINFVWEVIKKIKTFFNLDNLKKDNGVNLVIKWFRPWEEAKITNWGILIDELNWNFESKKISGLYFIGECLDVNWRTGGYNLQRCWTSGYGCGKWTRDKE